MSETFRCWHANYYSYIFSLQQALRKGPVVLYFFPAAFAKGCTLEAHAFAEATDDFIKLGATVVGVTAGNVDQVHEFSKLECRDKSAVAADPGAKVAAEYLTLLSFCHPVEVHPLDFLLHVAAGVTIVVTTMAVGWRWVRVR